MNLIPSNKLIAHLDMNSFFATVEQQANRTLRGKPLGVCAYLGKHGCILASSIEAKRLGVRTGMTIEIAKQRIPHMRFVQADPVKYRSVSARVFNLLRELSDRVEPYSIDEAFVDFTGWYRDELALIEPLIQVKQRIRREIGDWLSCSIGVAPTKTLAKLASDYQKPDGFTMISQASAPFFLETRQLTDIAGIGFRHARRLQRLGIFTALDFFHYPTESLLRLCGKPLAFLQAELRGCTSASINNEADPPKSVGHSYCVPRNGQTPATLFAVFMKLVEKAGRRLRRAERQARGVHVAVSLFPEGQHTKDPRWRYRETKDAYTRFDEPLMDAFGLMEYALQTLERLWDGERPVSFLAVTFTDLCPITKQARLSSKTQTLGTGREKQERLTQALDHLSDKYGRATVLFGPMIRLKQEAPDRIGFRKIEDPETFV